MTDEDADRAYPDVAAVAMDFLINQYKSPDKVGPGEIERTVGFMKAGHPDVITDDNADRLRFDLRLLVDKFWATLADRKNSRRFNEIVRGALR